MIIHFVEVSGIPKERVHAGLRKDESWYESDTYTLFLTANGRLTDSNTKRVNVDDISIAERLLSHWKPALINRDYGDIEMRVRSEQANAWQMRRVQTMREKVLHILENEPVSPKRKYRPNEGRNIIALRNLKSHDFPFDSGYLKSKTKTGKIEVSNNLSDAKRYNSSKYCENICSELRDRWKLDASVNVLTTSEIESIKEDKHQYWGFVLGRKG